MATAQQIINDAAGIAGILPTGQSLSADINSTAISMLNDMLTAWESEGIYLGIPNLVYADTVNVNASDLRAIKLNLAVELMMAYSRTPRLDVSSEARLGKNDLRAKYHNPITLTIPVELRVSTAENILTGQ